MPKSPRPADDSPIGAEERERLFAPLEGRRLALCVSGGADSMALMHLVAEWAADETRQERSRRAWRTELTGFRPSNRYRPRPHIRPAWYDGIDTLDDLSALGGPPPVVVLTIDHGLRPEAAEEAAFVAAAARDLGLPHQTVRWTGPKSDTALQSSARSARRALLVDVVVSEGRFLSSLTSRSDVSRPYNLRRLVMAHHLEDQAETVLMRLARGTGVEGLGGMRPSDRITLPPEPPQHPTERVCALERPLLDIPKSRLIATLAARNAAWIEDPSNDNERFERVRIRKALAMLANHGVTSEKLALTARRTRDVVEAEDAEWFGTWGGIERPNLSVAPRDVAYADFALLGTRMVYRGYAVRALKQIMRAYGGAASKPDLAQVEEFYEAHINPERQHGVTNTVTLGGCHFSFHGEHGRIMRVCREPRVEDLPPVELLPGDDVDWDGGRFAVCHHGRPDVAPVTLAALGREGWASVKREVPALGDLGLPAIAVASLPALFRSGELVAAPGVSMLLRARQEAEAAKAWRVSCFGDDLGVYVHSRHEDRFWMTGREEII